MGTRRFMLAAVCCSLLFASCGGASARTGSFGDSASAVPAGALVFVDVNTDRSSDAWKAMNALGKKFPGYQRAVAGLRKGIGSGTGSCSGDVSASFGDALGHDLGIAVTSINPTPGASPNVLVAADVADMGKMKDAITSCQKVAAAGAYKGYDQFTMPGKSGGYAALGDGMLLLATTKDGLHEALDVRTGTGRSLADDSVYTSAAASVPDGSLVAGYVDAQRAAGLLSMAALAAPKQELKQLRQVTSALDKLRTVTFSVRATDRGIDLHGAVQARSTLALPKPAGSALLDRLPADTFAFLAANYGDKNIQQLLDQSPSAVPGLSKEEQQLARDVETVLSGDSLLYLRPGLPVAGGLLLKPADPAAALGAVKRLATVMATAQHLHATSTGVIVSPGIRIGWRRVGSDLVAVGNDPQAGQPSGGTLADSATYKELLAAAGAPADADVGLYVDVPSILKLDPAPVDPNLKPLGGIALWSASHGQTASADLFVQIR